MLKFLIVLVNIIIDIFYVKCTIKLKYKGKTVGSTYNFFESKLPSIESIEDSYKPRELSFEQKITRFAPSPTGLMHIGGLYAALISERIAHQSHGIFYLRIEDTDQKREVENAVNLIIDYLNFYGIYPDEGLNLSGEEKGNYGPYIQSKRKLIYQAYAQKLLKENKAYPCFCSIDTLEKLKKHQEINKERSGYYGSWAKCRALSPEEINVNIKNNKPFVIRFKSSGNYNDKMIIEDLLKGTRELPVNDLDIVIMKQDGLPTYHFAHVIDDHLMGTTHVIRGDEWFSSVPLHLQLFATMNWNAPKYAHIAPILKLENNSKRKLSKRKDPEADLSYYQQEGYPKEVVIEYLLNLANSNFEDWRKQNLTVDYSNFHVELTKLPSSGALLDLAKLNNISKDLIGAMNSNTVFNNIYKWAQLYDLELLALMNKYPEYIRQILAIERDNVKKVRKDIAKWSDVKQEISYFFDEFFIYDKSVLLKQLPKISYEDILGIVNSFLDNYVVTDNKEEWFNKILKIANTYGYAKNAKEFKANLSMFKGDVSDIVTIFRILLTGRSQTPDLYLIMQVLGKDRVQKRLNVSK